MKKLILITILSLSTILSKAQITIGSISDFTQIQNVNGSITTTTPLNLQYGVDYTLKDSIKILGMNLINPKVFGAVGIGHSFNGSNIVINYLPVIAGVAVQPVKNVPMSVGIGVGANLVNGKLLVGINTEYSLAPVISTVSNISAKLTKKSKVKHNLKISI